MPVYLTTNKKDFYLVSEDEETTQEIEKFTKESPKDDRYGVILVVHSEEERIVDGTVSFEAAMDILEQLYFDRNRMLVDLLRGADNERRN